MPTDQSFTADSHLLAKPIRLGGIDDKSSPSAPAAVGAAVAVGRFPSFPGITTAGLGGGTDLGTAGTTGAVGAAGAAGAAGPGGANFRSSGLALKTSGAGTGSGMASWWVVCSMGLGLLTN